MTFSVIIPTYNRCQALQKALEGLFRQDFSDYEVIVVNDGSTDHTREYLATLAADGKVTHVDQENRGPAFARNAGMRRARGIYLAFTDDDCIVPPDWLRRFYQAFQDGEAEVIGGAVRNCLPENVYSEVSQEMTNHFMEYLGNNGQSTAFLTSNNLAYKGEAVLRAGGFDERFTSAGGEERALNLQILRGGGRGRYAPTIIVDHYHHMTAQSFFTQQRNYGKGAYLLSRTLPGERGARPRSIPLGAHCSFCLHLLLSHPLRGLLKVLLYLAAQTMVVIGFLEQARDRRQTTDG
jgi:glycosyltransferase involved in cell wall biosynthesis